MNMVYLGFLTVTIRLGFLYHFGHWKLNIFLFVINKLYNKYSETAPISIFSPSFIQWDSIYWWMLLIALIMECSADIIYLTLTAFSDMHCFKIMTTAILDLSQKSSNANTKNTFITSCNIYSWLSFVSFTWVICY